MDRFHGGLPCYSVQSAALYSKRLLYVSANMKTNAVTLGQARDQSLDCNNSCSNMITDSFCQRGANSRRHVPTSKTTARPYYC